MQIQHNVIYKQIYNRNLYSFTKLAHLLMPELLENVKALPPEIGLRWHIDENPEKKTRKETRWKTK